jgi:hypothetical protein
MFEIFLESREVVVNEIQTQMRVHVDVCKSPFACTTAVQLQCYPMAARLRTLLRTTAQGSCALGLRG